MPADAKVIQADWENREQVDQFTQGIQKIAEFLNRFGTLKAYIHSIMYEKELRVGGLVGD